MLAALGNGGLARASDDNVVDEAGQRGHAADEKGDNGAPVARKLGRVPVHAMEIVHVRH